jgi:hypothetical protein
VTTYFSFSDGQLTESHAWKDNWNGLTRSDIGGAADNLSWFGVACIDLAQIEVRALYVLSAQHMSHNALGRLGTDAVNPLEFSNIEGKAIP